MSQAALKIMKNNNAGKIVNIASIYGSTSSDERIYGNSGRNNSEIYSTTKAGVISLTKYMAAHFGKYNIQTNSISPGGIYNYQSKDFVEKYEHKTPMNRMGKVQDLLSTLFYLISEDTGYTNGQDIAVDGGFFSVVKKVFILGGGVTGLAVAYELLKRGQEVEIIEKSNSVGGLAKTEIWKGKPIDMGPHIYHTPDKDIKDYFLTEFKGLFYEREHWAKNFKNNKFYDYPISREFINSLPNDVKDKINKELSEINSDELSKASNYYEYTKALAGETLQELFFTKYPEKLWGLSTRDLDANWAPKGCKLLKSVALFTKINGALLGMKVVVQF